jgi:ferredoxin
VAVKVDKDKCTECDICVEICLVGAITIENQKQLSVRNVWNGLFYKSVSLTGNFLLNMER